MDDGTLCKYHVCDFFVLPTFCDLLDMWSIDVIPPNFMISLKDGAPSWTSPLTWFWTLSSVRLPVSRMSLHNFVHVPTVLLCFGRIIRFCCDVLKSKLDAFAWLESSSDVIKIPNPSEFLGYAVSAWNDTVFNHLRVQPSVAISYRVLTSGQKCL